MNRFRKAEGKMPNIDPKKLVEVKTRDGQVMCYYAGYFDWSHSGGSLDLVKWRVAR